MKIMPLEKLSEFIEFVSECRISRENTSKYKEKDDKILANIRLENGYTFQSIIKYISQIVEYQEQEIRIKRNRIRELEKEKDYQDDVEYKYLIKRYKDVEVNESIVFSFYRENGSDIFGIWYLDCFRVAIFYIKFNLLVGESALRNFLFNISNKLLVFINTRDLLELLCFDNSDDYGLNLKFFPHHLEIIKEDPRYPRIIRTIGYSNERDKPTIEILRDGALSNLKRIDYPQYFSLQDFQFSQIFEMSSRKLDSKYIHDVQVKIKWGERGEDTLFFEIDIDSDHPTIKQIELSHALSYEIYTGGYSVYAFIYLYAMRNSLVEITSRKGKYKVKYSALETPIKIHIRESHPLRIDMNINLDEHFEGEGTLFIAPYVEEEDWQR